MEQRAVANAIIEQNLDQLSEQQEQSLPQANADDEDETMTTTTTAMTGTKKMYKQIVNCEIDWPNCSYTRHSRRHAAASLITPKERMERMLLKLNNWHRHSAIAIDGMNGTGKSTLAANLPHRHYLKINELAPYVTCGSSYNFDPLRSLEYMMMQQCMDTGEERVCWDRCRYSNLIFYYVHHLMFEFQSEELPLPTENTVFVYKSLNELALETNLLETLTLMETDKQIPTFFLVCSDPFAIGRTMLKRAMETNRGTNDAYNAKEYNYQLAQYYAYTYFARILNYPCIDIIDAMHAGYTLSDLQAAIRVRIDIVGDYLDTASSLQTPEGMSEAKALADRLGNSMLRETLVFTHSCK